MDSLKLTIGFSPLIAQGDHIKKNRRIFTEIQKYASNIYDIHFPHYNPHICASGRTIPRHFSLIDARRITLDMIEWNQKNTQIPLTLLLNYMLHDNYKVVVDNFVEEFYSRGVHSVVVADLELIKRLKDRLPDLHIQGSCLSNRITEAELEEERREGVELHNPSVNIIRQSDQIKRNAEAGYPMKVICFEGCLHQCPDESAPYGHRWYLARSLNYADTHCLKTRIATDPRYFFRANWITIEQFKKKLKPYIAVVKLPRSRSGIGYAVPSFIDAFENDRTYNVLDFIGAGYREYLDRDVGVIPSNLFDEKFFQTTEQCNMKCKERGCMLCFDIAKQIKRTSYKQKRLVKRSRQKHAHLLWAIDGNRRLDCSFP